MPILRFADGVILNTGGKYRLIKLPDGWYVVGQGHFVPVADREEGETMWAKLTKARQEERGRLPVVGEPDLYNKRLYPPPPDIKDYRVAESDQNWFNYEAPGKPRRHKVFFLQRGAVGDPRREGTTEYFYVASQIPYCSKEEAHEIEDKVKICGAEGLTIETLMEVLLETRRYRCELCLQCKGFGSVNESIDGCAACGGLGLRQNS